MKHSLSQKNLWGLWKYDFEWEENYNELEENYYEFEENYYELEENYDDFEDNYEFNEEKKLRICHMIILNNII